MSISAIARNGLRFVQVDHIHETLVQLRSDYADEPLDELGESLDSQGMLQPVILAPVDGTCFELIIGSRRLRAARQKNAVEIPAVVLEEDSPLNYLLMALSENLHREDLSPFEEANAFLRLMRDYGMGTQEVARKTHKNESYIRQRLELLAMPEQVQELIAEKKLALHFVSAVARLPSGEQQVYYAEKAVRERFTLAELRQLITSDAGEDGPRMRREFSPDKVRIKLQMLSRWVRRFSANSSFIRSTNAEERKALIRAIQDLETQLHGARAALGQWQGPSQFRPTPGLSSLVESPDNHGDEWSIRHVEMITASDRPSDEVLATKLGRTTGAIRAMRFKMEREQKK